MLGFILFILFIIFLWANYHSGRGVEMAEKEIARRQALENRTPKQKRADALAEKREIHRLFR